MHELQIFNNNQFGEIRTLEENGKILFCGSDVAKALGYDQPHKAIDRHCKNGTVQNVPHPQNLSKTIEMKFIPEGDLYRLITNSKLPSAEKFEAWVFDDVLPTIRKHGTYTVKSDKSLDIKMMNAKVRMSNQFLKLSKVDTLSKEYKNILVSKATEVLTGELLIPLPNAERPVFSATEIGNQLGISKQLVGSLTNKHNLKTDEYGQWRRTKSEHSVKEVDTFVYYDNIIPVLQSIIAQSA